MPRSSRGATTRLPAMSCVTCLVTELFAFDVGQQHRLGPVVLQRDDVVLFVGNNLRRDRHLALALAVPIQPQLDDGERIVDRSRTIGRFPEADAPIGHEYDALAALGQRELAGEMQ